MTIPFSYEGALRPGQSLAIRDINGSVRVRAGDRLAIHAIKTSERGQANDVQIRVENRPNGLIVCVRYPPDVARGCDDPHDANGSNNSNNDTSVAFDVTLPHGVVLDARTVNGAIDAQTDGPADAETVNGSVQLQARSAGRVHTVNGSLHVTLLERGGGSLDARTINGSIEVTLPSGSGASLVARTVTGGIDADGFTVEKPRYGPGARVNGTVGDGARKLDLATVNGSITVRR